MSAEAHKILFLFEQREREREKQFTFEREKIFNKEKIKTAN